MSCERCQENQATVHVTEIEEIADPTGGKKRKLAERHLCESCAAHLDLPHVPVQTSAAVMDVWKLLQMKHRERRKRPKLACPECETTLDELQRKGRLGCPTCYDVFETHLVELFERMHGAAQHVGRLPGVGDGDAERIQRISDLRDELDLAVQEEAYERAASIRDELRGLEPEPEA